MDNGCIHNGTAMHHEASLIKSLLNVIEDCFPEFMLFQQMTELQQGCGIRNLFLQEVESNKVPHSVAVVDRVFETFVRKVEPDL